MTTPTSAERIVIPRGGRWGQFVEDECARRGAMGVVVPIIENRRPRDHGALTTSLAALAAGRFDWVFVTSASTVEVLEEHRVVIPATSLVAAVGSATAAALARAGYRAAFVPVQPVGGARLVEEWAQAGASRPQQSILVLRSDLADATVSDGLEAAGHRVVVAIAYRTVGVDVSGAMIHDLRDGRFAAVLVTSHSVAAELASQVGALPPSTVVACLGPATAREAQRLGLGSVIVSPQQTVGALIDTTLSHLRTSGATP